MSTTVTLDTLHQRVVQELWGGRRALLGLTTGAGSTTSLVMASLANSSQSTNAYDGVGVYFKSVTAAPKESYVTRGGFTAASGTFAMSPAYGSSPGSAVTGYFLYGLTMAQIDEAINNIIRTLYLPRFLPLSLVVDGDMDDATSDWTAIGGITLAKSTGSTNALLKQSLDIPCTNDGDGARSVAVNVNAGEQLLVSVPIMCDTGTADVELYDADAAAVLSGTTYTTNEEKFSEIRFEYTVPAGVERIAVQITQNGATAARIYVGWVAVLSDRVSRYNIPFFIADTADIMGVYHLPEGGFVGDEEAQYLFERRLQPVGRYKDVRDYFAVRSNKIEIDNWRSPVFVETRMVDSALVQNTDDTDTTPAPVQVVVDGAVSECLNKLHAATGDLDYKRRAMEYHRKYKAALDALGLGKPTTSWRPVSRVAAV